MSNSMTARRRSAAIALAMLLAFIPTIASANSLSELWARPVRGTFGSAKSALALEYCIGGGVSDWGYPFTLHGEGVTDIWAGLPYAIRITDDGRSRTVKYTATAAYDDRVGKAIGACL